MARRHSGPATAVNRTLVSSPIVRPLTPDLGGLARERLVAKAPTVPSLRTLGGDETDVPGASAHPRGVRAVRDLAQRSTQTLHAVGLGAHREPERLHLGSAQLVACAEPDD